MENYIIDVMLLLIGVCWIHIFSLEYCESFFSGSTLRITIRHLQEHKNFIVVHNIRYNRYKVTLTEKYLNVVTLLKNHKDIHVIPVSKLSVNVPAG